MLLSHNKKFIFLKTLKTAGTSVEMALQHYCAPPGRLAGMVRAFTDEIITDIGIVGARGAKEDVARARWRNHMAASEVRAQIDSEVWGRYLKFTTIRNPYDRVVSHFHYKNPDAKSWPKEKIFRKFNTALERSIQFGRSDRDIYLIDGEIAVDRFIRYESLQSDFDNLCRLLGLDLQVLPRWKTEQRGAEKIPYREYYGGVARKAVQAEFEFELETFGYEF